MKQLISISLINVCISSTFIWLNSGKITMLGMDTRPHVRVGEIFYNNVQRLFS